MRQVGDEMIVYDHRRKQAHSLNHTAALVWCHCDGTRSVAQLAQLVSAHLGATVEESIVDLALDRLADARLLEPTGSDDVIDESRREALKRIVLSGAAAAFAPAVLSIAAPTPAMAASAAAPPPDPGPD
jgi:coenzyme PQQ synthesis protein D (PqqD)